MVCLAAWTAEALCAHPMMSQEVPPDQHFETISARNIYIQTRRAVHEFYNVGLLEEFLSSNMLYLLRKQPPPSVYIV